jgi:membrane-associated PAP2 superfamily phosphatase
MLGLQQAKVQRSQSNHAAGFPSDYVHPNRKLWQQLAEPIWLVLVPLFGLLLLSFVIRVTDADIRICRMFYEAGHIRWPFSDDQPWVSLYHLGPIPGLILGIIGGTLAVGSLGWKPLRAWRTQGLFLALMLALGPGLVVNGILKPHWGRPRPGQIREFGGKHQFVDAWQFGHGPAGICKSFPSGHASMGFFLMAPAFLLYRRRPTWAVAFLGLGLIGGLMVGMGRIAQGQHFPSDVLWAGGMVYLVGMVLAYIFQICSSVAGSDGAVILALRGSAGAEPDHAKQEARGRRGSRRAA